MRQTVLALSLIAGLTGLGAAPALADASVTVGPGGIFWQNGSGDHWRERQEWRQAREERHEQWLYNHCVRDWKGVEYCR